MHENVESATLNLRYESYRLRDNAREARLLTSIIQRGIEQPLEGVDTADGRFLLNGFKRYRCAHQLGIASLPYLSLGQDEAAAIVQLMRGSRDQALGILEQARFIHDLFTVHQLSLAEVAETLSRSKGWVSMRRRLLEEISPPIQELLFRGAFPVYSYLYTLRPFRRMNGVQAADIDRFIQTVAGRRLSVRDIELLAHGYFRGPAPLREAIERGQLGWSLEQMKQVPRDEEGCNDCEQGLLRDLESLGKLLQRVPLKCQDPRLTSRPFFAQANLLTGGLLSHLELFQERMKAFYDRSGHP